jgi:hypothetical protein
MAFRRPLAGFVLSGLLTLAIAAPAFAVGPQTNIQRGGAAGLVAAVVQVAATVGVENIDIANNSLNNLLQNADIHVLENILNNSVNHNDVLSNITITVEDVLNSNNVVVSVLSGGVSTGTITVSP